MPLSMSGHIDQVLQSVAASRTVTPGSYVDGIWTEGTPVTTDYTVNVQPVSDQELYYLNQGGERLVDVRVIHVNDGDLSLIDYTGVWNFIGLTWKTIKLDNRYWNDYCRIVVSRIDDQ